MSNWYPNGGSGYPQSEDSLLEVQKRALFKRSYVEQTALARAVRTATTSTATLTNPGYKGIIVTVRAYAVTAPGGIKIRITTGNTIGLNTAHIDAVSTTAAGNRNVEIYPGGSTSASLVCNPCVLGPRFIISIEHDTADPIDYEVSYTLVE